ncbi:hypothetical protein SERLA73DRAFT_139007 [Serpula lacrymans var. lacrymans S7.3]|uniref:Uncharacterized protein n=1 Tax=Serpula lacrymans var. lacrymans (strain S7.3) TaxID=936435 RepID=F8Q040_SERL3|nr:hypothetical protein SERLA73DRAFT_139007 [Serpula lacrymans var. lacrymans S7.3]
MSEWKSIQDKLAKSHPSYEYNMMKTTSTPWHLSLRNSLKMLPAVPGPAISTFVTL